MLAPVGQTDILYAILQVREACIFADGGGEELPEPTAVARLPCFATTCLTLVTSFHLQFIHKSFIPGTSAANVDVGVIVMSFHALRSLGHLKE